MYLNTLRRACSRSAVLEMFGPLVFEGPEETFGDCVVVAATSAAHGAVDAQDAQRVTHLRLGALAGKS